MHKSYLAHTKAATRGNGIYCFVPSNWNNWTDENAKLAQVVLQQIRKDSQTLTCVEIWNSCYPNNRETTVVRSPFLSWMLSSVHIGNLLRNFLLFPIGKLGK